MYDVIIVGSGPAGVFAAMGLKERNILMLDVGYGPSKSHAPPNGHIFKLRQRENDLTELFIGKNFQGLANIHKRKLSFKLKSPGFEFVTKNYDSLLDVKFHNFDGVISYARGGLANAWGAGVYEFSEEDLSDFPISINEITPFFKSVADEVGVSGSNDDLTRFFSKSPYLMPPLDLPRSHERFMEKYDKYKNFLNNRGFFAGRSRLAIVTKKFAGRNTYENKGQEFFHPYHSTVYTPRSTLGKLRKEFVTYRAGILVDRFEEQTEFVIIYGKNLKTGSYQSFRSKKLILAAGTINTSRIVLRSKNDFSTKLSILDNPITVIPFIDKTLLGSAVGTNDVPLALLNIVYQQDGPYVMGSVFGTNIPLVSDKLFHLPLDAVVARRIMKLVGPATSLLMLFYPGQRNLENFVQLQSNDQLLVSCVKNTPGRMDLPIIKLLRQMGYWVFKALTRVIPLGSSIHYAGTLPMSSTHEPYSTSTSGLLFNHRHVYIADGACFSALPAKNLTFMIMANSLRIATAINQTLR